jgi:hypothetical protein
MQGRARLNVGEGITWGLDQVLNSTSLVGLEL